MAGEHPVEAHEFQLKEMSNRLALLEEQMQEMLTYKARSEVEVRTVFKVLDEVKGLLKEYTVEMKKAMADLAIQFTTKLGQVEADVRSLKAEPGDRAQKRWELVLSDIIKLCVAAFFGFAIKGLIK